MNESQLAKVREIRDELEGINDELIPEILEDFDRGLSGEEEIAPISVRQMLRSLNSNMLALYRIAESLEEFGGPSANIPEELESAVDDAFVNSGRAAWVKALEAIQDASLKLEELDHELPQMREQRTTHLNTIRENLEQLERLSSEED